MPLEFKVNQVLENKQVTIQESKLVINLSSAKLYEIIKAEVEKTGEYIVVDSEWDIYAKAEFDHTSCPPSLGVNKHFIGLNLVVQSTGDDYSKD